MPKSVKISLLAASVVMVLCLFLGVNAHGVHAAGDAGQEGAAIRGPFRVADHPA